MDTKNTNLGAIDIETEGGKQLMQALFTAGVTAARQGDLSVFISLGNALIASGACQHTMILFNTAFGGATMDEVRTWMDAVQKGGEEKFKFLSDVGRKQVQLLLKTNEQKIQALTGQSMQEIVEEHGGEMDESTPDEKDLWN